MVGIGTINQQQAGMDLTGVCRSCFSSRCGSESLGFTQALTTNRLIADTTLKSAVL